MLAYRLSLDTQRDSRRRPEGLSRKKRGENCGKTADFESRCLCEQKTGKNSKKERHPQPRRQGVRRLDSALHLHTSRLFACFLSFRKANRNFSRAEEMRHTPERPSSSQKTCFSFLSPPHWRRATMWRQHTRHCGFALCRAKRRNSSVRLL
ncbi:hypothetical protein TGMAS_207030 [Toxoplasma gondii MAS]|uniref:Uncharacterized protein n=6 Tax=Toxoplasma gondii TaxID=5811 RepID=V4YIQ4_TOXGV|nr:hypothetical protein TGVEG_207030 [Toxoplasma gondii VEG]KFG27867.1 hypothetical protein TGP89_207030 [Toxoplasma gondii p89]KFG32330.1 hypothetical protein TGFOU_207030 [Toxoplasma gondii FOU]KFH01489.1 hypothetical protein TGMAS_207030 [Toxoplasma gondii MAS]PIL96120.1 hypothetical protein TGCOUG_207030 [Toxoplasma gondii COUG]PUA83419.1 hypothetical protein TGBR9_207030 [Toxoplasma gondii TgCATBr9]